MQWCPVLNLGLCVTFFVMFGRFHWNMTLCILDRTGYYLCWILLVLRLKLMFSSCGRHGI
uniref:Uncharacterized protein n=1 Tax=Arundo donax TaxID=35708 RepID=A0A0A9FTZ3_ARUDO